MRNDKRTILSKGVYTYLFLMLGLFPLYFRDAFFDIQRAKFLFFAVVTSIFIIGMCSIILYFKVKDKTTFHLKDIVKSMSYLDKAILLFFICACITTIQSPYPWASFIGNSGRWLGLFFYILVIGAYFLISRYFEREQSIFLIFLLSCGLVSFVGLLNFLGIDPLGFYTTISKAEQSSFLTTIGNIDIVGALVCLILPMSLVWFCFAKDQLSKIIYGVSVVFGFLLMIVCRADSAYLGIGFFFLFFFFFVAQDITKCKRYILALGMLFLSAKGISIVSTFFANQMLELHGLSKMILNQTLQNWVLCILLILYIGLYVYEKKNMVWNYKKIRKVWLLLVIILILGICSLVFYVSFINVSLDLGEFQNYLRLNIAWGSNRGFVWDKAMLSFQALPFHHQIFGYGLETTNLALVNILQDATLAKWNNAHNEYLQYLLNGGVAMLLAYLGLLFTACYEGFKTSRNNLIALTISCLILTYAIQAIVNINQPITTPIFFIMIAILESVNRSHKVTNHKQEDEWIEEK